ncbi:helix-turn-helix domain-containing protein [Bacteroides finegoldii]|jgi:AraC-like DNA-binding protein|uniref:AraC-type DNA-binding domain-containing proteins n=2 Tax=Bacteroides finegoldii TaxID=338188 RepID=A0A173WGT6_9BACE|nr:AraC family transcriptional regulator [Bacteroides finegoldii]KAA5215281.1 helix-turn-helix transcriptional regulator [Bacteroides finegoldii]KAA5218783.1 helix-turn-helix transcriptional regulator [Bacteroides finegoldii]KAA5223983.1 helix-turn-helix transcriptional regulator [Bacteroides finegoldii]KAA5227868.1 helix-turn-helix transcriptional regulator [Bacteroides finegoldii]KAA5232623.1 helix-turn-helix transcriptional regulator [Bacteroides finegoldii]
MRYIRLGVCICILLFVHNQILMADEATNADSITTEYIRSIYIEKPKCALKLLDVAENKKSMPLRVIDELRSLSYRNLFMNKLAYVYARKSYVLDSVYQKDPEHLLKMTVYLAELSFLMSKYNESMNYALDGIAQSKRLEDRVSEARLLYCIGENNRMLSFKDKAYDYFDSAIDLLKGRKGVKEIGMLSSFYGGKMSYLMTDSLYEDASVMALEREKQIKKLETLPDVPKGLVDMQYGYLYSKWAYNCYMEKKYGQAEKYFAMYQSTEYSRTPDGKMYSIPYLLASKHYKQVIDNSQEFKELMRKQQDTINAQYMNVLEREVQAYMGMGNYKEAAILQGAIIAITDSINNRDKENAALELNTMYDTSEKEDYIAKQAFQLKVRNITLTFLTCITLLTLFVLWRMWRFNHIIRYKNKILAKFINERLARKKDSQSLDIDEQLMISQDIEDESILFGDQEEISDETGKASGEEEENKKIFIELNRIVVQDQLYLSSELSREDLAQLVHLNNARFARMIKECTGTNFNGYINDLRIDYAIKLLKLHPNYTIRAIADEVGFNSTPILYNLFKKKTGMTPYEFKKAQESL